jgi:hypothetical protein
MKPSTPLSYLILSLAAAGIAACAHGPVQTPALRLGSECDGTLILQFTNRGDVAYDIINIVDGTREMLGRVPSHAVQSFSVRSGTVGYVRIERNDGIRRRNLRRQPRPDWQWRCI